MQVGTWEWLSNFQFFGKHFLRLFIFFVQKNLQFKNFNFTESMFTLFVIQVKIVVFKQTKNADVFNSEK